MPLPAEATGTPGAPAPPGSAREPAAAQRVRVAVCVATYRRPVMLRELLASLGALELRKHPADVLVVVVDNDRAGSARTVVEGCRGGLPFELHYVVEPERNISLARNRGVALALRARADHVAFIDDDEVAHPGWLDELLDARARFGADAVGGAVLARHAADTPSWVVGGGFFGMRRLPSGTPLPLANTNNALVSQRLLRQFDGPFDPEFGLSGGGDSLFFMRCQRAGARLVYADEAVVEEAIPLSRARARWILRRAFRTGNCAVFCERRLGRPAGRLRPRVVKALARMALGTVLLPAALPLGRRRTLAALWSICYGAGCLAALAGFRYVEYRHVHGE